MDQLIELPINRPEECQKLVHDAERELSAFISAIIKIFGVHQARPAIDDWMEEMVLADFPDHRSSATWRRVTIAAAARLINRICVKSQQKAG